jgi:hypothetical protein
MGLAKKEILKYEKDFSVNNYDGKSSESRSFKYIKGQVQL